MTIRTPNDHTRTEYTEYASQAADLLRALRTKNPLVQCLTNTVVTNFTANVLLCLGASPAMVDIPGEAGVFAGVASGVLVNLGTPHAEQREAMLEAAQAANEAGTPWVLDPVAIGALTVRTDLARQLLEFRPTIIRGNASEIIALVGSGAGGRGVDATDEAESALPAARELAHRHGSIVAVSGPTDVTTDGDTVVRTRNGHRNLTLVTGGGCALGAVMAGFASLAVGSSGAAPLTTTVAAVLAYTVAAELAAAPADAAVAESAGPGSFSPAFLDRLHDLDPAVLADRARIDRATIDSLDDSRIEQDRA